MSGKANLFRVNLYFLDQCAFRSHHGGLGVTFDDVAFKQNGIKAFKKLNSFLFVCFCNRGDTIQYHGGLQSRELGQAPMLLVFLTPRQALSSHPRQQIKESSKNELS